MTDQQTFTTAEDDEISVRRFVKGRHRARIRIVWPDTGESLYAVLNEEEATRVARLLLPEGYTIQEPEP